MKSSKSMSPHNGDSLLASEAKLLLEEGDQLLAIPDRVGVNLMLGSNVGPGTVRGNAVSSPSSEGDGAVESNGASWLSLKMVASTS